MTGKTCHSLQLCLSLSPAPSFMWLYLKWGFASHSGNQSNRLGSVTKVIEERLKLQSTTTSCLFVSCCIRESKGTWEAIFISMWIFLNCFQYMPIFLLQEFIYKCMNIDTTSLYTFYSKYYKHDPTTNYVPAELYHWYVLPRHHFKRRKQ